MNEMYSNDFELKVISKIEAARNDLRKILNEIKKKDYPFFELPLESTPLKIAAIDGGGFSQDFVGATIVPCRAVGGIFEYNKNPIWIEINDLEILTIDEDPKNFAALLRDYLEIKITQKVLEYEPKIIFLDGSITNFAFKGIPQSVRYSLEDKKEIEENSPGYKFYELFLKYIKASYELIKQCIEKNILLVGVSKDSRSNILINHIYGNSKDKPIISDTSFVSIIAKGKTGFTKPIAFSPEIRDVRKEIWKAAQVFQEKELQSVYLTFFILKENAQPVRVDTLLPQSNQLTVVQKALVTYHDGYGFITPAYLVHKKAHMNEDLGTRIINILAEKVFDDSPLIYKIFLDKQRRDKIQ